MYRKSNVPANAAELPGFLDDELSAIESGARAPVPWLHLSTLYVAPAKVGDGMVVLADGTRWNPGSGRGFYGYSNGAWRFLG